MAHGDHGLGAELFHQVCRDVIAAFGQPPLEGDLPAYPLRFVHALRRPGAVAHDERLGDIDHLVAGRKAFLHGQGIKKRLDG